MPTSPSVLSRASEAATTPRASPSSPKIGGNQDGALAGQLLHRLFAHRPEALLVAQVVPTGGPVHGGGRSRRGRSAQGHVESLAATRADEGRAGLRVLGLEVGPAARTREDDHFP